jgi:hypothetical protein
MVTPGGAVLAGEDVMGGVLGGDATGIGGKAFKKSRPKELLPFYFTKR